MDTLVVTYIPAGYSEPVSFRVPADLTRTEIEDEILDPGDEILFIRNDKTHEEIYVNPRYK